MSSKNKLMSAESCSTKLPFVCFKDNLVLVKENKTWEEALEHCRAMKRFKYKKYDYHNNYYDYNYFYYYFRYDLVSVQPGDDHHYMTSRIQEATTDEVWVGLRFLESHWLWMDRKSLAYQDIPSCPSEYCGVLTKNETVTAEARNCKERRNFLCYDKWLWL
ncbi:hypothetical protein LDENG_00189800 [Lucifuga dentata]|nr:hypothetical protein LDENG_00189800 [Lucifuga dentata]